MSKSIQALSMLLVFTVAAVAQAHCGECGTGDKTTKATTVAAEPCEDGVCPIEAAMEKLPKITFAVGEKTLCCEKSAVEFAETSGGHVHFCVGEEEFDDKANAQVALVEATEKFVSTFTEPHTCEASGKITVAGAEQDCIFCAGALAKKMNAAMDGVEMTYMVGEKECSCPVTAGKLAKEAGVDKQFVVGEEKTCCEHTARLNLARAKYKAAVTVLTEATATEDASEEEQGA